MYAFYIEVTAARVTILRATKTAYSSTFVQNKSAHVLKCKVAGPPREIATRHKNLQVCHVGSIQFSKFDRLGVVDTEELKVWAFGWVSSREAQA